MEWEVEYTDEFGQWWDTLTPEEQEEVNAKVELLEEHGPTLPRPHSDVIVTSKHNNMKELRAKYRGCQHSGSVRFRPKENSNSANWRRQNGQSKMVRGIRSSGR